MIYLSGKITGLPPAEAAANFKKAERKVLTQQPDADIFNPFEECSIFFKGKDPEWSDYMRYCVALLVMCDQIHMLPNWKDSKGAKIEHDLAKNLGIEITYHAW